MNPQKLKSRIEGLYKDLGNETNTHARREIMDEIARLKREYYWKTGDGFFNSGKGQGH